MKYMKLGSKPDVFQTEGNNIRFVTTELATDIVITVGDVKFYLHKFPLLSKSSRLQTLVASTSEDSNDEVDISDIPGGPAAFEICAKFCYGMVVTLNAYNVLAARCAAEYLDMSESADRGNLVYKIDVFLSASVFRAWKDSIIVLQSTRPLLLRAAAEGTGGGGGLVKVTNHCVDAVAGMASVDPAEVDWSYTYNRKLPVENGGWNGVRRQVAVPRDWWVEDICDLEPGMYKKVVMAIVAKGRTRGDVVGEALRAYACRRLRDAAVGNGLGDCANAKHRAALDAVVSLLPAERGAVSCGLLLLLLRAACVLGADEHRGELVRRAGAQLDGASSASDLLIPADPGADDGTMYDVDVVAEVVEEFMAQHAGGSEAAKLRDDEEDMEDAADDDNLVNSPKVAKVAALVDGYLAEIAKDPGLPLAKFVALATSVPPASRPVHDGLYRAIDAYLKEHPGMTKGEKKRLCALMECKRLSADASAHAVQNERLPLRVVVQVLFFEQLRQSSAAAAGGNPARALLLPGGREDGASCGGSSRSTATTNDDDHWAGVAGGAPTSACGGDTGSLRSVSVAGSNKKKAKGGSGKVAPAPPRRGLAKLWSGKARGGENNSGSDTSESPAGSVNMEETKSTPSRSSRITRHSVS